MDLAAWFQELRRRRVIRALLGWGLFSFAVLQVVEPVQHALGAGEWLLKAVVAALAGGFPVIAGLSWAFDLTRHGIERATPPPEAGPSPTGRLARSGPAVALVAAGALLGTAVAAAAGWWLWGRVPEPGPDGRITVAVADIANETREPELDGLSGQLITSLEQSQRLRVLTRSRMLDVLRQLGKPGPAAVDEVLGREVALVANARALVVGAIRRFDDVYAIDLKFLDPRTSEYFFTLKEERTGKGSIPGMLDRLSDAARQRLRETPAQVATNRVAVADAVTASHEAWRQYYEGQRLEEKGDLLGAFQAYQRAASTDPRFAMAHYRMGYLAEFVGFPASVREAATAAAYREIDRVPAKERMLFHAWKAHVDGRDADAHAIYAQAAAAYPLDKEVAYLAGDLYLHAGDAASALPWFEKAIALDPSWPEAKDHVIMAALPALGRNDEAISRAREDLARFPGERSRRMLVNALARAGRHEEALEVSRAGVAGDTGWAGHEGLVNSLIMTDRFAEAEEVVRPFTGLATPDQVRAPALIGLVTALAQQGRRKEALEAARPLEASPAAAFQGIPVLYHFVRWELLIDRPDHAAALREGKVLADVSRQLDNDGGVLFGGYYLMGEDRLAREVAPTQPGVMRDAYEAITAWRAGEVPRALEGLQAAVRRYPDARPLLSWWIALLAFEAGRDDEAMAAMATYENDRLMIQPWRSWMLARLQYQKALALERKGDHSAARAAVERMLGWWTRADPDLPLLAETRALCRKLGCVAPGSTGGPVARRP